MTTNFLNQAKEMFDFGNSRASEGVSLYFKLISKKSKTIQNWTASKGYSYG